MINVNYDRAKRYLEISGHADYAPKGQDIVCAGVSTLVYTLINSCRCEIEGEGVYVKDDPAVYDAVMNGLWMIAKEYPKNLQMVPYRKEKQFDIIQPS